MLDAHALIAQPALNVRLHAHAATSGRSSVAAPELVGAPVGEVAIHADRRAPRIVALIDGTTVARPTDLGAESTPANGVDEGAALARAATARTALPVKNRRIRLASRRRILRLDASAPERRAELKRCGARPTAIPSAIHRDSVAQRSGGVHSGSLPLSSPRR